MTRALTGVVVALTLTHAGCGASGPSLKERQQRAVCAVSDVPGRLDLMPAGVDGIALRLVTPDRDEGVRAFREAWPEGHETGVAQVRVEEPRPRLAVVIDDLGLHKGQLLGLWSLGRPLTWSLLPDAPYTEDYAEWLTDHGASTLVHLPMEPEDPELISFSGYLREDQGAAERRRLVEDALEKIPDAVGINNHMGSLLTRDEDIMAEVVAALPPDLVVVDSRTAADSALAEEAREAGRAVAERTVFIDNVRDVDAIVGWLEEALDHARMHGHAVAIGHPYPETVHALHRFLRAHGDEVHIVPVERIAEPPLDPRWIRRCAEPGGDDRGAAGPGGDEGSGGPDAGEDAGAPEEEDGAPKGPGSGDAAPEDPWIPRAGAIGIVAFG
ncbi:MAG: divergent polysaccharide deacetylase family protein [Myxococcota bacterium]